MPAWIDVWTVVFSFMFGRRVLACRRVCSATEEAFQRYRRLPLADGRCGVYVRRPGPFGHLCALTNSARQRRRLVRIAIESGVVLDWSAVCHIASVVTCPCEWVRAAGGRHAAPSTVTDLFCAFGPRLGHATARGTLRCIKAALDAAAVHGNAAALRALGTETARLFVAVGAGLGLPRRVRRAVRDAVLSAARAGHADVLVLLTGGPWNAATIPGLGYRALLAACSSVTGGGACSRVLLGPPWNVPPSIDHGAVGKAVAADNAEWVRALGRPPFNAGAGLARNVKRRWLEHINSASMALALTEPPWCMLRSAEDKLALLEIAVTRCIDDVVAALGRAPFWDRAFAALVDQDDATVRYYLAPPKVRGWLALPPFTRCTTFPREESVMAVIDGDPAVFDRLPLPDYDAQQWALWVAAAAQYDRQAIVDRLVAAAPADARDHLLAVALHKAVHNGAGRTIGAIEHLIQGRPVITDTRLLARAKPDALVALLRPGSPWVRLVHHPDCLEAVARCGSVECLRLLTPRYWTAFERRRALLAAVQNDRLAVVAELGDPDGAWRCTAADAAVIVHELHRVSRRMKLALYAPPWNVQAVGRRPS